MMRRRTALPNEATDVEPIKHSKSYQTRADDSLAIYRR